MTSQRVAEYCLSKPGAVLDYPYGPEPAVFKAGGKAFATIYKKDGMTRFGMKCEPLLAKLLCGKYSSVTMMYKSPNWIYIRSGSDIPGETHSDIPGETHGDIHSEKPVDIPDEEIFNQIDHSYNLIVKSLPRKTRDRISAEIAKKPEMTADDVVDIIKLLERNGIEVYVDGGWGVDALLGEQTRAHADLDIALPHRFVPLLRELLETRGYKDMPRDDTRDCNFVLGDDKGHLVDVHSYSFDENGVNIFGVAYCPRHLTGNGAINGYPVKCPPPDVMVEFHTGYVIDDDDYRDVKALCERFGISLPENYK